MKNGGLFLKIGIPVLILAGTLFLVFRKNSNINWRENYKNKNKDPYGCYVISEMLKSQKNATFRLLSTSIEKDKKFNKDTNTTYVFIGEQLYLSAPEVDSLMNFVSRGNEAFISAKHLPTRFLDTLFNATGCFSEGIENVYYSDQFEEEVTFNFYDDSLKKEGGYKYAYRYKAEDTKYNWLFIDGSYFCDSAKNMYWISHGNDYYVNCFTARFGDGYITIHTNPVLFTNYMMKDKDHFDYADGIFSYVNLKNIIWDESSKFPYFDKNDPESTSPLKYILSQPALKTGWYILLVLSVLYILFKVKRRVRTIPVIEPKTNNSLAFLRAVSQLYQRAGDHKKIAEMKMKYFMAFLRDRYNYSPESISRPDFIESLSLRSGVDKDLVKTIFSEYDRIKNMDDINSFRLEDFNKLIHIFYVRCR